MTRRRRTEEAPGQDSFLDVVANLVGILIILVMVVGLKTRDALVQAKSDRQAPQQAKADPAAPQPAAQPPQPAPPKTVVALPELESPAPPPAGEEAPPPIDLAPAQQKAEGIESNIQMLSTKLDVQKTEIAYRRKERDRFQLLVALAEREIAEQRLKMDQEQQQTLADRQKLLELQQQFEAARREVSALDAAEAPKRVIEHLPTPMARTVFGKEVHFRLLHGKLAYLPMDDLLKRFEEDLRSRASRTSAGEIHGSVGPVQGFRASYLARRESRQLDLLVEFTPVSDDLGEPVAAALSGPSQFQNVIGSHSPKQTTVTVWTYPDSFEHFREVKQWLFQHGYLTACRPLPDGIAISAAMNGSRSAAQ